MAKKVIVAEIDNESLAKAVDELKIAIDEFNKKWKELPIFVRFVLRLSWIVDDLSDDIHKFMNRLYNSLTMKIQGEKDD